MFRFVAVAALAVGAVQPGAAQNGSVLRIKVSVAGAGENPVPVARHALLISDNPSTAPPRRVVTTPEGTAAVTLRPGNYTVESDRPSVVGGRSYQWTQIITVAAGHDATLELTAANAEIGPATADMEAAASGAPSAAAEPPLVSPVLARWQDSTVALWTEHRHAAGFLVSDRGLVATSQSAIGDATSVEVQLSTVDKIEGRVIAADAAHDIAIVQIDPAAAKTARPVPLACGTIGGISAPPELLTIEVPMFGAKSATTGDVLKAGPQVVEADFALSPSSAGGPVFAGDGPAVGLTSMPQGDDGNGQGQVRVMPASAICSALATATTKMVGAPPAVRLPVEPPTRPVAADLKPRGVGLSAYAATSSDFDILFITPALRAGAEAQRGRTGVNNDSLSGLRAATEFGEWSTYVAQSPPVLFLRVTPKLVESFWMKFARGAASTQGAQIPPIMHLGPGFSRMRVLCGRKDVAPIHPFRIRTRISDTEAVDEGFYVFDPASVGPQCGTVSIVLSSVKNPDRTETKNIDPGVITRVSQDFAGQ